MKILKTISIDIFCTAQNLTEINPFKIDLWSNVNEKDRSSIGLKSLPSEVVLKRLIFLLVYKRLDGS